jgi:hypothetical protein
MRGLSGAIDLPDWLMRALSDPDRLIAIAALAASAISTYFARQAGRTARRALGISERDEQRRQPKLQLYLARSYVRSRDGSDLYCFLVSISNPTDIDNAVARSELRAALQGQDNREVVYRIAHNPELAEGGSAGEGLGNGALSIPLRIDAHQTVTGWLLFELKSDSALVNSLWIMLDDSHGVTTASEVISVGEWLNEAH